MLYNDCYNIDGIKTSPEKRGDQSDRRETGRPIRSIAILIQLIHDRHVFIGAGNNASAMQVLIGTPFPRAFAESNTHSGPKSYDYPPWQYAEISAGPTPNTIAVVRKTASSFLVVLPTIVPSLSGQIVLLHRKIDTSPSVLFAGARRTDRRGCSQRSVTDLECPCEWICA
jgi:hypothetical protein